jgi:hypothetical protein
MEGSPPICKGHEKFGNKLLLVEDLSPEVAVKLAGSTTRENLPLEVKMMINCICSGSCVSPIENSASYVDGKFFFFKFPNLFAICILTLNTISKLCVEKRGRVEECSVAPLRDKRVKTLCGCRRKKCTN